MSYSVIFTEITFYPESSILLQILRITHDISDRIQNLTGRVGSKPIMKSKLLNEKDFKRKKVPLEKDACP